MTKIHPCPHCQQTSQLLLQTKDYDCRVSDEWFYYYQCQNCKLVFLHPVPSNLGDYYPPEYYTTYTPQAQSKTAFETTHGYKLKIIQQFVQSGRFLEIGPGYGGLSYLAKESGFQVDAIELDADCCHYMNNSLGIHAIQSADPIAEMETLGHYNVIALWHVIEHVPNPWELLTAISQHLAPGGIVAFATPNPDALQFKVLWSRWLNLHAPRHLNLIPIDLLDQKCAQLGLKCKMVTTTDPGGLGINYIAWYRSFLNIFLEPNLRWLLGVVGRILHKLMIPVERHGLRGGAYTVIYQKQI